MYAQHCVDLWLFLKGFMNKLDLSSKKRDTIDAKLNPNPTRPALPTVLLSNIRSKS